VSDFRFFRQDWMGDNIAGIDVMVGISRHGGNRCESCHW
jgi:hypothetical protein